MAKTDRELLELAAKAAGWPANEWVEPDVLVKGKGGFVTFYAFMHVVIWNPLTDNGDALRLAVKLGISVEPYPYYDSPKHSVICKQRRRGDQMRESNPTEVVELYRDSDPDAATRRAIVRAAASIGESLQ